MAALQSSAMQQRNHKRISAKAARSENSDAAALHLPRLPQNHQRVSAKARRLGDRPTRSLSSPEPAAASRPLKRRKGPINRQHLDRESFSASQALAAELAVDVSSARSAKPARAIIRKASMATDVADAAPAKPWRSRWKSTMRGAAAASAAKPDFDLADPVVRELLAPVFKGGSSVAQSQRIASAVSTSGGASSSTSRLASVGARGAFPNNAERDLHRLAAKHMQVKPKISWVELTVVDVRSMKHILAAKKIKKGKKLTRHDKKLAEVVKQQKFPVWETQSPL